MVVETEAVISIELTALKFTDRRKVDSNYYSAVAVPKYIPFLLSPVRMPSLLKRFFIYYSLN